MNHKIMTPYSWVLIFLLCLCVGMFVFLGIATFQIGNNKDAACQGLGFSSFESTEDFSFCVDGLGNYYYVTYDDAAFFSFEINDMRLISVGNVRTVRVLR